MASPHVWPLEQVDGVSSDNLVIGPAESLEACTVCGGLEEDSWSAGARGEGTCRISG